MSKFSTTLRNMRPNQKTAVFVALALLINAGTAVAVDLSKFPLLPCFELASEVAPEPVPLRWSGGWVMARLKINGADAGWFKIGTGWKYSVIDPAVAARLKLPEIPEFGLLNQTRQPGSPGTPRIFRAEMLQCGQASAGDVPLQEFDLSAMSKGIVKSYGTGISGVLGWDLLKTLPFLLDMPALQMTWQRKPRPLMLPCGSR
jgi:hypothetical protein